MGTPGLSGLGGALTWGEARLLLDEAAADTSTVLGAHLAGWAYRATTPELMMIAATVGARAAEIMPWAITKPEQATPAEVASALAQLEDEIVFT
ncbi:hypothetical protein [Microbacterium sp. PAMC21962]|uniref:hypothetical protein n=1 Tax=Microbacterium sp. PAMC21962 TaxID=2861280 RepID=UPI002159458B|nr:hypothetical protein [Microbacterium sp. PAMC21962]